MPMAVFVIAYCGKFASPNTMYVRGVEPNCHANYGIIVFADRAHATGACVSAILDKSSKSIAATDTHATRTENVSVRYQ